MAALFHQSAAMNILRFSDLCAQGKAQGQRVFIRADLNVPLNDAGEITEDTRVRASVPCIEMALKAGAAVMVTSHLGRPTEGQFQPADSLAPVAKRLSELLGREVPVVADWVDGVQVALVRTHDDAVHAIANLDPYSGAQVIARGLVGTRGDIPTITSPMFKQVFDLRTGECLDAAGDEPRALRTWSVTVVDGEVVVG